MSLREAKKERARADLVQAAAELFEARGFDATRVADIAARAQLSHTTIHNHFAGKDGLATEWIRARADRVFEACADEAEQSPLRPALRRSLRAWCDALEADAPWLRQFWQRCRIGPLVTEATGATRLVRAAQQRGDLRRDLPPEQMGGLLMAALVGATGEWLNADASADGLTAHAQRALDLVLDGARRRNERVRPNVS